MSTFEEDLRDLLLQEGGSPPPLPVIVGQRIVWNDMPQGWPLPCVVLWTVSREHDYAMQGDTGLRRARVQCDCKAIDYQGAKALERAVSETVSGFKGTVGGTAFQIIEIQGSRDGIEPAGGTSAERRDVCSLDLTIWFGSTT
jgi:hypothetical protein